MLNWLRNLIGCRCEHDDLEYSLKRTLINFKTKEQLSILKGNIEDQIFFDEAIRIIELGIEVEQNE